jgi:hypothetical protein
LVSESILAQNFGSGWLTHLDEFLAMVPCGLQDACISLLSRLATERSCHDLAQSFKWAFPQIVEVTKINHLLEKGDEVLLWIPFLENVNVLFHFVFVCIFESHKDLSFIQLAWPEPQDRVALSFFIFLIISAPVLLLLELPRFAYLHRHAQCNVSFQKKVSLIKMSYPF